MEAPVHATILISYLYRSMQQGLSILIPIYNKDVIALVNQLHGQCEANGQSYEIICIDDHSHVEFDKINEVINQLSNVQYIRLQENIGRSAIRNLLARQSKYSFLLFLDCDSLILHPTYIENYLITIDQNNDKGLLVIYGGTLYQKKSPERLYLLHWNYGRKVEAQHAILRNLAPYIHFKSNNFIIAKKLILDVNFDEHIKGYGYEDLVLGLDLEKVGAKIIHIDNEVLHEGLETFPVYLTKIEMAISNLRQLNKEGKLENVRLIKWAHQIHKWKFDFLIQFFDRPLRYILKKALIYFPQHVFFLQCYKLVVYINGTENK